MVQNLDNNIFSLEINNASENCYQQNDIHRKNPFRISKILDSYNKKPVQYFIKRFIEINGTLLGLFIISPLLIAIAAAIKLSSKGSVLFKQKRIGKHGKEFFMYKFRSMEIDAEEKLKELEKYNQTNELMFKMFDDPRITKVGKFLRKYSLDELPQLFNVLKGEMSLVGFRPPLPSEVAEYKSRHYIRFATMPGLTGPWQVSGRSNIKNFDKVINLEYEYIKTWSLFQDVKILFKTIPVVLSGKDAA
ncbi:MAG TPA: UDP-phosphate galactose phosphotransferase [Cyanobacteria bacterium UBA9971]|nr:UDP-phosphate galactose phosphotransferase [Cyanobacteria bacterium UBA9971]